MSSTKYTLKAEVRERAGKGVARAIRREEKVPGVIYGDGKEVVTITLPWKETTLEYLKGHMFTSLCDLDVGGKTSLVLARDVQVHPVNDRVTHIDFLRVNPKTKIAVRVPVHFTNHENCPGLKEKGVLNVVAHDVEILCSAMEIPEFIEIDLAPFGMDDAIKLSHAKLPAGAKPKHKADTTVGVIHEPRRLMEEIPVAAPAAAEGAEGAAAAPAAAGDAAKAGDAKAAAAAPAKK